MGDISDFFESLDAAVGQSRVERALTVRFDLGSAGSWTLRASPLEAGSVEHDAPDARPEPTDCTLTCALDVLLDLANGRRKPAVAFMKGLISVKGDKSVFVALQPIIRRAARDFKAQREARNTTPSGTMRVVVHGASVVADSRESFAVYLLEIFEGDARWTLTRRWSEVRAVARRIRKLRASEVGGAALPTLPRTLDFAGSLEQAFLAKRAEIVASYLTDVLAAVPCSVLHASGPCPALRLFLAPNEVGDGAPGAPMSPLRSPSFSSPPHSGPRRTSMTDDGSTLNGFESLGGVQAFRTSASFGDRRAGSMLSPGWLPLNSPAPFSPLAASSTTGARRVEDVYATPLNGDDGDGADGASDANDGADNVGYLVEALVAAAAPQPIRAEHDEATLEARRGVLRRLRSFEAASKGETVRMRLVRVVTTAVDIGCRFLLPAALGVLAAAHGWALTMLLLLRSAMLFLIKCEPWTRVTAVAALAILVMVVEQQLLPVVSNGTAHGHGHAHGHVGTELNLSTAGASGPAQLVLAAATSSGADPSVALGGRDETPMGEEEPAPLPPDSAVPVPVDDLTSSPPSPQRPAEEGASTVAVIYSLLHAVGGEQRLSASAERLGRLPQMIITTVHSAPVRSIAALVAQLLTTIISVLFGRLGRVYSVGFSVMFLYWILGKISEALAKHFSLFRRHEDAAWSMIHRLVAPNVCQAFVELKSVFVKFGQYLGGRADIVPPEWAASLRLLQDDLPACPASHLRSTIRDEFGRPAASLFEELDAEPIASASVAQVHVGRLKLEHSLPADREAGVGTKVVLKLQHRAIEPLMRKDMVACLRLCRFAKWLNPDFHAMYTVMDAWQHEMFHEFDFANEAENLRLVAQNLRRAGVDAAVPAPIEGMVGRRAFAMTFEDGFKITDDEALAMHAVDREQLMTRVVQIYAQQLFVDGFFNADPHAGNLMVQVKHGRALPVLLDFGMTVKLTNAERLAYAELAFAAQQMDIQRLQSAVRALGIKNNQMDKDPSRDLDFWRFFLRDTSARAQSREQANAFFKRKMDERNEDQAKGEETRKLQTLPPSFVFFWRVIGLLRGLCASLDVQVAYMDILAARAKVALARCTPAPQRALSVAPTIEPLPAGLLPLHQRLASLCMQLCHEGSVQAGVQVCVQRSSATLAEACAGFRGIIDPRGMRVDVPMPLLELSTLVPVLAVHQLVASGRARYNEPLKAEWPGCEAAARAGYTIADALGLRVPLDGSSLWKQPVHVLADLDAQFVRVASSPFVASKQGEAASTAAGATKLTSSATAFATLLAGIVQGICGEAYLRALSSRLMEPLGLTGILHPGGLSEQKQKEAATASTGFGAQLQRFSAMRPPAGEGAGGAGGMPAREADNEGRPINGDAAHGVNGHVKDEEKDPTGNGPDAASKFAHEIPLNAGMVNDAQMREGCVPGLGSFSTARGMCVLMGAAARGETGPLSSLAVESGVETSSIFGERTWARGVQRYECTGGTEPHVLGMHSFSGSFAFCCPRSGVSVAILLNDGQLDYSVTRRILEAISEELGIGHIDFLGGGLF